MVMKLKLKHILFFVFCFPFTLFAQAQQLVRLNPQHYFQRTVPKGNYSGLTWLGGDRYAVVLIRRLKVASFAFVYR